MTPQSPFLEADQIAMAFGGIQALSGVSFTMAPGDILGLIGPNGSGQTILLTVIANLYRADTGAIHFLGQRIDRLPIHHLALPGLARTFQVARVFRHMSVRDNRRVPGHTTNAEDAASPQQLLQRARERHLTILHVDQNVREAVALADHSDVLELGRNRVDGSRHEFAVNLHDMIKEWLQI
jgi:branched-chain amino acid transport system ATP-binding protein